MARSPTPSSVEHAVGDVRGDLHADPHAGRAGQRDAVAAEADDLLGRARVEHRQAVAGERALGDARDGGGLAAGVVAGEHQHPAGRVGAADVAVAQRVARAVDAGRLAVPDADHAVDAAAVAGHLDLAAPDRGGGQLLVHGGHEREARVLLQLGGAGEGLVEPAERAALVARRRTTPWTAPRGRRRRAVRRASARWPAPRSAAPARRPPGSAPTARTRPARVPRPASSRALLSHRPPTRR